MLARYDVSRSYEWNYQHPPPPAEEVVDRFPGQWRFCGLPVGSPLGISAGPLLNGDWVLYYASLGFDVLTYKTVRSSARECYATPNLQPIVSRPLTGKETEVQGVDGMSGSWAVSFGMPSREPSEWRRDIERTRRNLMPDKILSVSVVGTIQAGWSIDQLADDYAQCALWARDSGADVIETNFSCPNVSTCDGQVYQNPDQAAVISQAVRDRIGATPLVIKIGHVTDPSEASALLDAVEPFVSAIALTNSVAVRVRDSTGQLLFDGQKRGICGAATRQASLVQTRLFHQLIHERKSRVELIGVGGIHESVHVLDYLEAGATATHLATAAMCQPDLALQWRRELRQSQ